MIIVQCLLTGYFFLSQCWWQLVLSLFLTSTKIWTNTFSGCRNV
jgi:hypothetical protein